MIAEAIFAKKDAGLAIPSEFRSHVSRTCSKKASTTPLDPPTRLRSAPAAATPSR